MMLPCCLLVPPLTYSCRIHLKYHQRRNKHTEPRRGHIQNFFPITFERRETTFERDAITCERYNITFARNSITFKRNRKKSGYVLSGAPYKHSHTLEANISFRTETVTDPMNKVIFSIVSEIESQSRRLAHCSVSLRL